MADFNFTTGPSSLPDIGQCSYNGCVFSSLFATSITMEAVKDKAGRTIMRNDYTLTVDGYATLPAGAASINANMTTLRNLLTKQAGNLVYQGRGLDLAVNGGGGAVGGSRSDVAWGPIPELLEFTPLGAGKSAKVVWRVKTSITDPAPPTFSTLRNKGAGGGASSGSPRKGGTLVSIFPPATVAPPTLLQFNYDTNVSYGEDGFSTVSMRGTLEIALTRPLQTTRTPTATADDMRGVIQQVLDAGIDLTRFRPTKRDFSISRDKRTLEWNMVYEETPYMGMPQYCTIARGTYNVRPFEVGMGLVKWLCTLRATYTVRNDAPRRVAWEAFLALWRLRMAQSALGIIPPMSKSNNDKPSSISKLTKGVGKAAAIGGAVGTFAPGVGTLIGIGIGAGVQLVSNLVDANEKTGTLIQINQQRAFPIDFSFDEGLYLDSKTISFSATWWIVTTLPAILLASGLWTKVNGAADKNLWSLSAAGISGVTSWLPNRLDPSLDVIVDFGGP